MHNKCKTCVHKSECQINLFGYECPDFEKKLRKMTIDLFVGLILGLMAGIGLGLLFAGGW